ncbi:MAG TPA: flagellar hook-basal body complex protein FliE [Chloroflexota bacterium]|nr:flagellar hook-basal body complex protein FliE [Chloroflexota bacterium]
MPISPVLTPVPGATLGTPTYGAPGAGKALDGFGQSLTRAVDSLNRLQQEADVAAVQLAAGEPVELHDVMIAQDQATLGFQLAVQVRNKLVEAYQDVMRMQL